MAQADAVRTDRGIAWLEATGSEPLRHLAADAGGAPGVVQDGLAVEIWPGVLLARDVPPGPAERAAALASSIPPGSAVARQAAVWVHTGSFRPRHVDVVLLPGRARRRRTGVHVEALAEAEVTRLGGVPVTTVARTALDVARWARPEDALRWLPVLRTLLPEEDDLAGVLARAAGRPGIARARRLLAPVPTAQRKVPGCRVGS